jgi:hypothetical protein
MRPWPIHHGGHGIVPSLLLAAIHGQVVHISTVIVWSCMLVKACGGWMVWNMEPGALGWGKVLTRHIQFSAARAVLGSMSWMRRIVGETIVIVDD